MPKLPIKLQVGIRDAWDSSDAPVQKAIRILKETIGVQVSVNPEWPILHEELSSFYPDKATFVPSVAATVESCCTALNTLVDDEANSEWADTLLERAEGQIRLFIEVSKNREPSVIWSEQQKGLVIALPKSAAPSQSYMLSFFSGNLLKVFNDDDAKRDTPTDETDSLAAADDWADVVVHNGTANTAVVETPPQRHHTMAQQTPTFDMMPDIGTVSRPDELLLKPPYHLIVRKLSTTHMEVECSNSPTLQFLSEYLKKWCRTNHNHTARPLCAEIKLYQSAFGLGVVYDRLTIASESRHSPQPVSPTILLALVEGVLGYKLVLSEGSSWTFRRDVEFRSSRY